ncbi:MAG: aminopeptidase N [Limisphaerales bacterium]|nr:MAG: aminopeptidase N [Limisphaerales bacterium]KAG0510202.1 MAG: aminopeptidase N [Limisphaerales bacterium]TXT51915.1 MAG: aminopeptidase N [Limisphaerales bacterium]
MQVRPATLLALLAFAFPAFAASLATEQTHLCRWCSTQFAPTPVDSPAYRKYAPDRRVDLLHLALDVTPDFKARTVAGTATLTFKPIATPLEELRLDAVELRVASVTSSEKLAAHQITDREIVLHFAPPIPVGKEARVTVKYSAEPRKGLYFRTPEVGYAETHLWTQGEPGEARFWFPSIDHPVEKFTSEVTCRVPAGMVALSNGRQVSAQPGAGGLTAFHWVQEKPHVNYLITLVAGQLKKIEDQHRDIPLEFWTTPSDLAAAPNSFRQTKHMMQFFEREIGVNYPWAKYGQAAVHDYHWGGMENTSLTTLNFRTLFTPETENLFSSDSLVAHELAHQWFGDLVTCKDWSHIWLNEGFATYYDWMWQGDFGGTNETLYALHSAAKGILANQNETRGMVWRKFGQPEEMFNYLAYPKGAWVLHMLRCQLGADLYRRCIRTYLDRHAYGSVETADLRKVIEELSGRSFERFFEQWVHGIGAPTLDVTYAWDEKAKLARVSVRQTQKISDEAHLFQFPLTLRFKSKSGTTDHTVQIRDKEEDFYVPLKAAPEIVRVDPGLTVLARINFKPAPPMLFAQLADKADFIGQHHALDNLAGRSDGETIARLKAALNSDPHYAIRVRAADLLKQARTDDSLAALIASLGARTPTSGSGAADVGVRAPPDARVRNAVVAALGGFYHEDAFAALKRVLATEKNPGIQATALRALGPYAKPEVRDVLVKFLNTPSYRDRLAEAAIAGMKAQDDPAFAAPLLAALQSREATLMSTVFSAGLDALASLARNEAKKDSIRDFLTARVNSPKERVRLTAITALGTLEDPRAIAALETFTALAADRPEKAAADKALVQLRTARKPGEDLKGLRTEVLDLQKSNRELKKDLETLKKKIEAK